MSEEMFGDFMSMGAWGEGEGGGSESVEEGPGSEHSGEVIELGGGIRLIIDPDLFRKIMHTPEITAQVAARCEQIADAANELAVVRGAEYTFVVSNRPENIRARGRVKTGNYKSVVDNERNSTLLKALAQVGSDPYPSTDSSDAPVPSYGGADYESPQASAEVAEAASTAGQEAED